MSSSDIDVIAQIQDEKRKSYRIDLHILHSVPTNRANRDEFGSPKTAFYGGVKRGRFSSQSENRPLRLYLAAKYPQYFAVIQTRYLAEKLYPLLQEKGIPEELCMLYARYVTTFYGKEKKDHSGSVMAFSKMEINLMAERIKKEYDENKCEKLFVFEKKVKSIVCKKGLLTKEDRMSDIGQMACFGRMMANDPALNITGAVAHAHSLTVHESEDDEDYLTAVDDVKPDSGSAFMTTLECSSGCYYRFYTINIDLFNSNMIKVPEKERREILKYLIEGCIVASLPAGSRKSMHMGTVPFAVLGIRRENSFDLSLADAFETPIVSENGYKQISRECLANSWVEKKTVFGERLGVKKEIWLHDSKIDKFSEDILND